MALKYKVDLNCDLGESFGAYKIGSDDKVVQFISSANVACGYHASDPLVMDDTVNICKEFNVAVGAHPGYPDLLGFGRRNMQVSTNEASAYIKYQVGALMAFCKSYGIKLSHVKPHGAMYNMAGRDIIMARAICESVQEIDENLILLGLAGSAMEKASKQIGLKFAKEVFADRGYDDDGSLVSRGKPGAMITDENEALDRVIRMIIDHKVKSVNGIDIDVTVDSVCVHGDGEKALDFVRKINYTLGNSGIEITNLTNFIK
ncbi:MAG: 5-oxoprolinase subunit PxpA [Christensenellaceae bacterium]|jgi:UPF0271 protein|nr:5-oxoprolinase subunit PxpA [Christensenellaceae bacterium]